MDPSENGDRNGEGVRDGAMAGSLRGVTVPSNEPLAPLGNAALKCPPAPADNGEPWEKGESGEWGEE